MRAGDARVMTTRQASTSGTVKVSPPAVLTITPATPFAIGLTPLDLADWITVDERLGAYLVERERLLAELRDKVFVEEADTRTAQAEVLELLAEHLPRRFPSVYSVEGVPGARMMRIDCAGAEKADAVSGNRDQSAKRQGESGQTRLVPLDDPQTPPLVAAAKLVQEDLVIMRKGEGGWRLVAAVVCFPSSWTLTEKFARPMQDIHQPVPGYGPGTRPAVLIERIFDNLLVDQPVKRANWSLHHSDALYHPRGEAVRAARAAGRADPHDETDYDARGYYRRERQTLRKLPQSGDILFTIRIDIDPIDTLRRLPEGREAAALLVEQLGRMTPEQLRYKGMEADMATLQEVLAGIAATKPD